MLKYVLVPLDGSKLAESALDYALQIVAPGGKVVLVSIVQLPQYPIYDFYPAPSPVSAQVEATMSDAIPIAKDYLERIAERIEKQGLSAQIEVEAGDPAEVITRRARELNVDIVVMSTHGRSGLGRLLFGSVTQKVLGSTVTPVLVVPNVQKEKSAEAETVVTGAPAPAV